MIVRRLCVTPAVGSVMQWLLTKRNRTTERTNRETARQQHGVQSPRRIENVSGNWSSRVTGKNASAAGRTAEAHQGGGARRGAPAAGFSGCRARGGADPVLGH